MTDTRFTSIDEERLLDGLQGESFDSLIKFMEMTVTNIGSSILAEDLKQTSFANLGTSLAKYQGAKDLLQIIKNKLRDTQKKALQEKR